MRKQNCWEFMGCRKNVSGFSADEFGVCPAVTCKTLNGVHRGMNGGRACWMVTGTMCGNKIQGSYKYKAGNCSECDFFLQVKNEEGKKYVQPETLLSLAETMI
jgi:hypothetical protein